METLILQILAVLNFIIVQCMVGDEMLPAPSCSSFSSGHSTSISIRCIVSEVDDLLVMSLVFYLV